MFNRFHAWPCLCLAAVAFDTCSAQVHRPPSRDSKFPTKYSINKLPVSDLSQVKTLQATQAASTAERARAARYSSHEYKLPPLYDPATKRILVPQVNVDYLDHDPLPAAKADVVVVGKVMSMATHLAADAGMLYSTFQYSPTATLKTDGQPLSGNLTLDSIGGIAAYPNGTKVFVGEVGKGIPEPGYTYALFLKRHMDSDSFEILAGYCLDGQKVDSLNMNGDSLEDQSPSSLRSCS